MQNNKRKLNRLYISQSDLLIAQRFAKYILNKGLTDKTDKESKLVLLAFNTSLIVSYIRPFSSNKEEGEKYSSPSIFLTDVDKVLDNQEERRLHEQIRVSRNQEYAHSDFSAYSLGSNIVGLLNDPFFDLLTKDQVNMLATMIKKWLAHIDKEIEASN